MASELVKRLVSGVLGMYRPRLCSREGARLVGVVKRGRARWRAPLYITGDHRTFLALARTAHHFRPGQTHGPSFRRTTNGITIRVDVKSFKPEEVSVKVEDSWLVIEAVQHTWSKEHSGIVHKHSMRRYELPDNADIKKISSTLKEGVLMITVPIKQDKEQ